MAVTVFSVALIKLVEQKLVQPELKVLLDKHAVVFENPTSLPPRRLKDHTIPLIPGARPVSVRPYRIAPHLKDELEKQIKELLDSGMIRHSNSAFSSPVLLVKKKEEGTWRMVVDYRQLNAITEKGKYLVPVIDELLDELAGACWFSKLDLKAGYYQIRLAPGEEYKTAFQTHNGHYEFNVMGMGLTGAPGTFQGQMNFDLSPVLRKFALVFFDDILIFSKTLEEHWGHLDEVLSILHKEQWKVKMSKCDFAQPKIAYLGHVISAEGVSTDPDKIVAVKQWPTPQNVKEVRGFLGLSGYYRKFIKHYGIIARPLTDLLKNGVPFVWTSIAEEAFITLKNALVSAPVLALPDFSKPFMIETDACDYGIGAVLMQQGHPLAFVSKTLGPKNRALSVYEKEYLAILLAVDKWRPYLQVQQFTIKTDQRSLAHLQDQRLHTVWQQKCLTKLLGLHYRIQYKQGVANSAADALSRRPPDDSQLFAISSNQPTWLVEIVDSYKHDERAMAIMQQLAVQPASKPPYSLVNGLLRYKQSIWVGPVPELHHKIFSAFHDSPLGGHSGFPVTYKRIHALFTWNGMKKFILQQVQSCLICQKAKPERVPYPGLLSPLPIPHQTWDTVSMDFINGLSQSSQYNCILVVIDKFSKYGHFIPLKRPFNAQKVAEVFLDNVYKLHGMPSVIISDRDPLFTSHFWKLLVARTGTQLNMSTANHPETDGQTERVNQQVECYLRCFISAQPHKWSKWLPLCEFWYNSNWHSALGKSPFEILYGYTPRYFGISATDIVAPLEMQDWLQSRQAVTETARQHLLRAQQCMKHQADKKRTERVFAIGDSVFLKLQPYAQLSLYSIANQKLAFKYYGPFPVLERIGDRAYRLGLPDDSRLHPVFHVSQLKKFLPREIIPSRTLPTVRAAIQVPLSILQKRVRSQGNKTIAQGLVHWSESSPADATWEDLEHLKQQFPRAPAWGQAGSQGGRNVSTPEVASDSQAAATTGEGPVPHPTSSDEAGRFKGPRGPAARPTRVKSKPRWHAGPDWM